MKKYTFIMEFKGGTYISQVEAKTLRQSFTKWVRNLKIEEIKYLGKQGHLELMKSIKDEVPILLSGLINVWCVSCSLKVGFILINIVETNVE